MDIPANTDIMALAARVNLLGYAFAVTSYSQNGLAVQEGIEDVIDLALLFEQQKGTPDKKYVLGVSQGGLISALTLERHPELFDGGWALCGPYGDFREQSDYFAHARVLFDYFFPDVLAGSPIEASASLMDNWGSFYAKVMQPILTDSANAHRVDQLLATAGIAFNADDENSKAAAIETVLWYNTFTVNDGIERFGGQPFDNMDTVYSGSEDDTKLNDEVARFVADAAALAAQEQYQTTGALRRPLITIHTTRDPLMPYVQLERYQEKINQAGAGVYYQHIESNSYGHCQFSDSEILQSLNQLEALVESAPAISTDAQNINIFLKMSNNKWVRVIKPAPNATVRLFCLPYAGGGASIYRQWHTHLPSHIEVCAIQLPGRESRIRDAVYLRMQPLAQELAKALQHSMGSMIAYELTQQLKQKYAHTPRHLMVSGRRSPLLPDPDTQLHKLPDDQFFEQIQERYNAIPDIVQQACPITAFGGQSDARASQAELQAWNRLTTADFALHMLPGGHFYLNDDPMPLLDQIGRIISGR